MLSSTQLTAMRELEITKIAPTSLIDINSVKIDTSLSAEQRIEKFIAQIGNPYCFLCGDTLVKLRFVSAKKTLAESLRDYFISLR